MMKQIQNREDAEFCTQILSSVILTYHPLYLKELVVIAGLPETLLYDLESLYQLVDFCDSFLTIQKDMVYFIH